MRARYPDIEGFVERDRVTLGYEVFGDGDPTILLMPTWTIIHSRFWKLQVPYLARRYRVVTYDGPGNGRSDRCTDPSRYTADSYAADAVTVLDRCSVDSAVVVGMSLGARFAAHLAGLHPDRVRGVVLVASALPLLPPLPERAAIAENFLEPYPENPQGWQKYNRAYWRDHYAEFASFFFNQVFTETHSTKPKEDAVAWAMETGPEILEASERRSSRPDPTGEEVLAGVRCPALVVHGTDDRLHDHQVGVEAARITGGSLVSMEGSGHAPMLRDPVKFNLILRRFIEGVAI